MHCRHSNSYIGACGPEDLLVPHPIKGIVKVTWLDPYASCLLFFLGFDLSAIKPVNIACFTRQPFLFCFANCRWFVITDNIDQVPSPWWEGWESWESQGVVWDIQIVFDAFIVMMLELGVDGAIRCGARWGA